MGRPALCPGGAGQEHHVPVRPWTGDPASGQGARPCGADEKSIMCQLVRPWVGDPASGQGACPCGADPPCVREGRDKSIMCQYAPGQETWPQGRELAPAKQTRPLSRRGGTRASCASIPLDRRYLATGQGVCPCGADSPQLTRPVSGRGGTRASCASTPLDRRYLASGQGACPCSADLPCVWRGRDKSFMCQYAPGQETWPQGRELAPAGQTRLVFGRGGTRALCASTPLDRRFGLGKKPAPAGQTRPVSGAGLEHSVPVRPWTGDLASGRRACPRGAHPPCVREGRDKSIKGQCAPGQEIPGLRAGSLPPRVRPALCPGGAGQEHCVPVRPWTRDLASGQEACPCGADPPCVRQGRGKSIM